MCEIYDVNVIASDDQLKQIGIPIDADIKNVKLKAWDLGDQTDLRFGKMAKVSEIAKEDHWWFYIPVSWLFFLPAPQILDAVITATWDELKDIGLSELLKGDKVKVWDYGLYPDKEFGDSSKVGLVYDEDQFFYIPNKFIEIV